MTTLFLGLLFLGLAVSPAYGQIPLPLIADNNPLTDAINAINRTPIGAEPIIQQNVHSPDPECTQTAPQTISYWGYPVETYEAVTTDGYILTLFRIPHGRNQSAGL